jgi:hypothetical protein
MAPPASLRLPHPHGRASVSYVLLALAAAWAGGMAGAFGAMALLASLGVKGSAMIWGLVGAPVGMVVGWRVVHALWRPVIEVRRAGRTLLGLAAPLQVEDGRIRVRTFMSGGKNPQPLHELSHQGVRGAQVLFRTCPDPGVTRDVAEALCKLGGFDMEWVALGGASEVRPVAELDVPLAERLRRSPHLLEPTGTADAEHAQRLTTEELPDGGVRIRLPGMSLGKLLGSLLACWGLAAVLALVVALGKSGERLPGYPTVFAVMGGGFSVICLLAFLGSWVVRHHLEASADGIRQVTFVLGVPVRSRLASAATLEEVILERRHEERLVLVGDGYFWPTPSIEGSAARLVRNHLLRGLVGGWRPDSRSRAA